MTQLQIITIKIGSAASIGKGFLLPFLPETTVLHGCTSVATKIIARMHRFKTVGLILCQGLFFFFFFLFSSDIFTDYALFAFSLYSLWWLISCNPYYLEHKLQYLVGSGHWTQVIWYGLLSLLGTCYHCKVKEYFATDLSWHRKIISIINMRTLKYCISVELDRGSYLNRTGACKRDLKTSFWALPRRTPWGWISRKNIVQKSMREKGWCGIQSICTWSKEKTCQIHFSKYFLKYLQHLKFLNSTECITFLFSVIWGGKTVWEHL